MGDVTGGCGGGRGLATGSTVVAPRHSTATATGCPDPWVRLHLPTYLPARPPPARQTAALSLLSTLFTEGSAFYRMSSLAHMGQEMPVFRSSRGVSGPKIAVD